MKDPQDWLTVRISSENSAEFLEAIHIAATMNDAEGANTKNPESRLQEAHRRIIIDWLLENRFQYRQAVAGNIASSGVKLAQLDAMSRDGYRCRKCNHSKVASGGVVTMPVVAGDMIDPRRISDRLMIWPKGGASTENLVTLCRECAEAWGRFPAARRIAAVPKLLRSIAATSAGPDEEWIERVVGILLKPESCPSERQPSSASRNTGPSTATTATPPPTK